MRVSSPFSDSRIAVLLSAVAGSLLLAACSSPPLMPYSADTPPLVLAPASDAGVQDRRGRFREIFCAVLESHGHTLPDYRSCEAALTRVGSEPAGTGQPVALGPSKRRLIAAEVPGFGDACVKSWLCGPRTVTEHLRQFGYDAVQLKVDALSSSENNARQIRDAIMAMPCRPARHALCSSVFRRARRMRSRPCSPIRRSGAEWSVVSAAGAVGGSPLANDAEQYEADLLRYFPGSTCDVDDRGAVASLRPATRLAWLGRNPLPGERHYYSLVAFPQPERSLGFSG